MTKPIKKKCDNCGAEFSRDYAYLSQPRNDPLFKWTCSKCDKCKEKRINQAFKRLPKVMEIICND